MTAQDVLSELHTDAAREISSEAARSRLRKEGKNTLFDVKRERAELLSPKAFLCDPSILLWLFACLLAVLSGQLAVPIASALFVGVGTLFSVRIYRRERTLLARAAEVRIPRVTVIRDGKRNRISATNVLRGDLLLLRKGDIVPCDCRLLEQRELTVQTLFPDANGAPKWRSDLKNADEVYPYGSKEVAPNFANMLYGGSQITGGVARAVAVATGADCFLEAFSEFSVPAEATGKGKESSLRQMRSQLRFYSLLLLLSLMPLTVIGALTLPEDHTIVGLFLSLCALVGAGAQAVLTLYVHSATVWGKESFLRGKRDGACALLKTEDAMERLSSLSDLFVLGPCACSDGVPHLFGCATGHGALSLQNGSSHPSMQSLCEAYLLLSLAKKREISRTSFAVARDTSVLQGELVAASGFDVDAMYVRVTRAILLPTPREAECLLEVQTKTDSYRLLFSETGGLWNQCVAYENDGRPCAMNRESATRLQAFYDDAIRRDCRVVSVARQKGGRMDFLGSFAVRERGSRDLPKTLERLRGAGVRVTFFLSPEDVGSGAVIKEAGLWEQTRSILPDAILHEKDLGGARVIVGASRRAIYTLLCKLNKTGRCVGLMGMEAEDLPLMHRATMSIACDASARGKTEEEKDARFRSDESDENRITAAESVRRYADVLVPRSDGEGGGLRSLEEALLQGRAVRARIRLMLSALSASQVARLLFAVLSVLFGAGLSNGAQAAYAGLFTELMLVIWILLLPLPRKALRQAGDLQCLSVRELLLQKRFWLPVLLSAAVVGGYAILLSLFGVIGVGEATSYLFASQFLLQCTAFFVAIREAGASLWERKGWIPFLALLLSLAIAVTLSVLLPPVGEVSGVGNWSLLTLLSLPVAPVICLLLRVVMIFFHRTSKDSHILQA